MLLRFREAASLEDPRTDRLEQGAAREPSDHDGSVLEREGDLCHDEVEHRHASCAGGTKF